MERRFERCLGGLGAVLCMALLLAGCTKAAGETSGPAFEDKSPVAVAPSLPEAPVEPPQSLRNQRQWLVENEYGDGADIMLDGIIAEGYPAQDVVSVSILYPSHWPGSLLGDFLPEYQGVGVMWELTVFYPKMSTRPDTLHALTLAIAEYDPVQFQSYAEGLVEYGYRPVSQDEVEIPPYAIDFDETYALYASEWGICALQDTGGAVGVISVAWYQAAFEPIPPAENTALLHYLDFAQAEGLSSSAARLDQIEYTDDSYGRTSASNLLPSAWPHAALGNIIPEYTYTGFLQETLLTYPKAMTQEDILIASVFIGAYEAEDLMRYVQECTAQGFRLVDTNEYNEQDRALWQEREELYVLAWPGIQLYVGPVVHDGRDVLQISVRFDGRYRNFW